MELKNINQMKFEVIPNEQTPRVPEIEEHIELFFIHNINELVAFKAYAETRNDAVGLAANQVSIDGKRFMVRVFALRNLVNKTWRLIIDPHIIEYQGIKDIRVEGCLTWMGQKVLAERSRAVHVQYYDELGKKCYETPRGFEAQIWQHEINHLNGVEEQIVDRYYAEPRPLEVGRNDQCPCGSGKKYKHCCLI